MELISTDSDIVVADKIIGIEKDCGYDGMQGKVYYLIVFHLINEEKVVFNYDTISARDEQFNKIKEKL